MNYYKLNFKNIIKMSKNNVTIGVEVITPEGKEATRTYGYEIERFASLGKEIKISPKSHVTINKPGYKTEFFTETVTLCLGIGNHHVADLIMTKDAWEALNYDEKIHITTTKEFKKKYIHKK